MSIERLISIIILILAIYGGITFFWKFVSPAFKDIGNDSAGIIVCIAMLISLALFFIGDRKKKKEGQ